MCHTRLKGERMGTCKSGASNSLNVQAVPRSVDFGLLLDAS